MNDKQKRAIALGMIATLIEIEIADDNMEGLLYSSTENDNYRNGMENQQEWAEIIAIVRSIQRTMLDEEIKLQNENQNDDSWGDTVYGDLPHAGFYLDVDGQQVHVLGDPNAPEETMDALREMVRAATKAIQEGKIGKRK